MAETTEERRRQKIEKLKAQLQKEEALVASAQRKERNGQLIAFGVYVEELFKATDDAGKERLQENIQKHLTGRNLERAMAGLIRLAGGKKK